MSDRTDLIPPVEGEIRNFGMFVATLEDGDLHEHLTKELERVNHALSEHVIEHGGKPSATLTLTIKVTLDDGVFVVRPAVKTALPESPRRKTHLWGSDGGRFARNNPRQQDMFAGPRPIRTA